jgi:hypothetical protein
MNWTCAVYGGAMTAIIIWWIVDARKWFKGPKVNIEHQMVAHDVSVDGIGDDTDSGLGGETKPTASTQENVHVSEKEKPSS